MRTINSARHIVRINNKIKGIYPRLLLSLSVLLLLAASTQIAYSRFVTPEQIDRYRIPFLMWPMMGLNTDNMDRDKWIGTDVSADYNDVFPLETLAEKETFVKERFAERIRTQDLKYRVRAIIYHLRTLYGRVDMAPGQIINFRPSEMGNNAFRSFADDVRWTKPYLIWNGVIFYGAIVCCAVSVCFKRRSITAWLAFFGLNVFYQIWEVNPRYLTNFWFVILFLCGVTIDIILNKFRLSRLCRNKRVTKVGSRATALAECQ
jgi:hypothetical protein